MLPDNVSMAPWRTAVPKCCLFVNTWLSLKLLLLFGLLLSWLRLRQPASTGPASQLNLPQVPVTSAANPPALATNAAYQKQIQVPTLALATFLPYSRLSASRRLKTGPSDPRADHQIHSTWDEHLPRAQVLASRSATKGDNGPKK